MITTEAIKIAKNIEDAQKKARIDLIANGVLVCLDTAAGKYAFVKYEDLPYLDQTIGIIIKELSNLVKLSSSRIDMLEADLGRLNKEFQAYKQAATQAIKELEEKFNEAQEEGDPL
jgi:hypothetical protein